MRGMAYLDQEEPPSDYLKIGVQHSSLREET